MKSTLTAILVMAISAVNCQPAPSFGGDPRPIVDQRAIADIACGPSAIFNWMSQGGDDLQQTLTAFSVDRTPVQTVRQIIDTYGMRESATRQSVTRYGPHNGGVGSINLMLMARELLADHLESPPPLRGEYLHRVDGESTAEHLDRITGWFSKSIESGVPVLFYIRGYRRTSGRTNPGTVFGHHVVITALDRDVIADPESSRVGFTFVDSSSGRVDRGVLLVAEQEFTAPTFMYRFDEDGRALTTETVRTGRPLLEVRVASYESAHSPETVMLVAHFATFADDGENRWRIDPLFR